ncbi:MAG TPA: ABC transporter substrate-binding protein [Candidatus Limnocylindrales bacterium]|nr:ABC transporter substrate-binding protein [Candidatus Limnocylindrales bacterium]
MRLGRSQARWTIGPLGAALAIILSACAGAASPSAGTPAPAASGPAGSGAAQLPPPETTKVTIGLTNNLAAGQFVDQFAKDLGTFQKYGLDVTVIPFEGDSKATQALVSGQIEGAESSGGMVIASQKTDAPLVTVALNNLRLDYVLIGAKGINTADDLRGKQVGVSSLGSVAHAVVLAALKNLNLTANDVTITAVGSESARIAAVTAGSIQAAPVQVDRADKLKAQGLTVLTDLTKTDLAYATAGLGFRKDWLEKNPNTALRLVASLLEAQETMFAKPDLAAEKYAAFNQSDLAVAKSTIDSYVNGGGNRGMRFTQAAFELPQEVLETIQPDAKSVDLKSVYDLSYLDKLQQLGFDPKAGVSQ